MIQKEHDTKRRMLRFISKDQQMGDTPDIKDSNNVSISATWTPDHIPWPSCSYCTGGNTGTCVEFKSVRSSRPIGGGEIRVPLAIDDCEEKNKLIYSVNTQNSLQRVRMRRLYEKDCLQKYRQE